MSNKSYKIENYKSEEHKKTVKSFVDKYILYNQTFLVDDLFKAGMISTDDVVNLYISLEQAIEMSENPDKYNVDDEKSIQELENELGISLDEPREVFSWYLVDEWFARRLEEAGQPVLTTDYGTWWGRTGFGQMIYQDGIIQKVVWDIMNKSY